MQVKVLPSDDLQP
jgi:hypothetical protein